MKERLGDSAIPERNTRSRDSDRSAPDEIRVIRSEDLFAGRRVVVIRHADAEYRLLVTRNDRLILQK